MNYFFGPLAITYKGASLGKTFGGVEIDIEERVEEHDVIGCPTQRVSFVRKVSGKIHKFEFEEFAASDTLLRSTESGTLILTGSDYKATIVNCFLCFPQRLTLGTNEQQPFDLSFYAFGDGTTDVFTLEET